MEEENFFYRCSQVNIRGQACAAGLFILNDAYSIAATVFRTVEQHNHNQLGAKSAAGVVIGAEAKKEIERVC